MHGLIYFGALLLLVVGVVALLAYRPKHPWRSTTPPSNEERYLDWVQRYAAWEQARRVKKAQQRMRVLRRLDARYAKRMSVHVP